MSQRFTVVPCVHLLLLLDGRVLLARRCNTGFEDGMWSVPAGRRTAGPRGLSSYLDTALAEKLERDEKRVALLAYLDELEATDPTTEATKRRARKRAERIRVQVTS